MDKYPVGVFASIGAGLGVRLEVVKELGIHSVQLCCPHKEMRTQENARDFIAKLNDIGATISVVFCDFKGESYATIQKTRETIGLVPKETRAERKQEIREIADFAKTLGCSRIGIHIGFIPHETDSDDYRDLVGSLQELADYLAAQDQAFHLETGQETADGLERFLSDVGRENVFINFDPANMILYGSGEPLPALKKLGKWVRSCHCKDAKWSAEPGKEWGAEVPFGTGDVNAKEFFKTLKEVGYEGPLTIEREIPAEPERQKAEISQAKDLIEGLKREIFGVE
ncbi:MAG: sugar phosphate isomerase/epimerase family protein [Planctomycetia bacterium]|nr:sugar phosphate isomerase/epimerase family protein [Planctomycetia bacterium]